MHTRRPWLLAAALALPITLALGCDDDEGGGPSAEAVLVQADVSDNSARVVISDDGTATTGATVEVNGIAATPGAAGEYLVTFPSPLNAGDPITLSITAGDTQVDGTGTFPEGAVTTLPIDGGDFLPDDPVAVAWTSTTDPLRWVVVAEGTTSETFDVAGGGGARTHEIPGFTLAEGGWVIQVVALAEGELDGDLEEDSFLNLAASATADPVITIGPQPM
jgi:hypothetical protein